MGDPVAKGVHANSQGPYSCQYAHNLSWHSLLALAPHYMCV